jgi:hypothetical protein
MSLMGQTEKSGHATGKSALPTITDIVRQAREVRKVPEPDILVGAVPSVQLSRVTFLASAKASRMLGFPQSPGA